jgi:hypothetical protein
MARTGEPIEGIVFHDGWKYDFQLKASLIRERKLAEVFAYATFMSGNDVSVELKSETWQWEKTGNLCVEYKCDGRPSGIARTEAHFWVHELLRGQRGHEKDLIRYIVPMERMKELARRAIAEGRWRAGAGDGKRFHVALIPLIWMAGLDAA